MLFIWPLDPSKMKTIAFALTFAFLAHLAAGDDLENASPTPTPYQPYRLPRPADLRREQQIERNRELKAAAQTNAQARAEAKAERRSLQAESREASKERDRAQKEVAAESRRESAQGAHRSNSDLMARMGFSPEEVAAEKAHEQEFSGHDEGAANAKASTSSSKQSSGSSTGSNRAAISSAKTHLKTSAADQPASATPAP